MEIEWKHPRCIVCLEIGQLTVEHVIPKSLGGILTSRFLCKSCNDRFGAGFEANARLAPELRKAASGLGGNLLNLKEKLETGAYYLSQYGELKSEVKLRKDGQLSVTTLEDGSRIVPEVDFPGHIATIMQKRGIADHQIDNAISTWEAAPSGVDVDLGEDVCVRKWQDHPAMPAYTEPPLSMLVPLKIAYEFVALVVGGAVYCSSLQHIRDILNNSDEAGAAHMVTYKWARKPDAFHGITFEGNRNVAQFQVRFFGLLAYTVRFPKVAIEHSPIVYTHRLDTGDDWVRETGNSEQGSNDES
ncbi:MAG: HNH endonuclease [Stappiaceae bacterium]